MSECSFPGQNSSWKRTSWGKDFLGKECGFHWSKLFANLMVCHLINMIVCFCDRVRTLLVLLSCSLLTRSLYIYMYTHTYIYFTNFGKEAYCLACLLLFSKCFGNRRAEFLANLENHTSRYVLLRCTRIFKSCSVQHPGQIWKSALRF